MIYNSVIPNCFRLKNFINSNIVQFENNKIVKVFLLVIGAFVAALSAIYYFRISRRVKKSPIEKAPDVVLNKIHEYLDDSSYLKMGRTKKDWLPYISKETRFQVMKRVGCSSGGQLKKTRPSWKSVLEDFDKPFEQRSRKLSETLLVLGDLTHKAEICAYAQEPNLSAILEEALKKMDTFETVAVPHHPLHLAASKGYVNNAELLIRYGITDLLVINGDPDELGTNTKSALFLAASNGHVEMVKLLLQEGAKVLVKKDGQALILRIVSHYCLNSVPNDLQCLFLLIQAWKAQIGDLAVCRHEEAQKALTIPFYHHIGKTRLDIVNLLIGLGISIKEFDRNSQIIVKTAIENNNLLTIKFLHERSLVDYFTMERRLNLLKKCKRFNAKESREYFSEIGISSDFLTNCRKSEKRQLKLLNKENIINLLHRYLRIGDWCDPKTGLSYVGLTWCLEDCKKLKIDLNIITDDEGNTLLHQVATQIYYVIADRDNEYSNDIYKLLEYGVDPTLVNKKGETVLTIVNRTLRENRKESNKDAQYLITIIQSYIKKNVV